MFWQRSVWDARQTNQRHENQKPAADAAKIVDASGMCILVAIEVESAFVIAIATEKPVLVDQLTLNNQSIDLRFNPFAKLSAG